MFPPMTRRLGNIFIIVFLCIFGFTLYRPIDYRALPNFDTSKLTYYLNGTNPFGYLEASSVECIPISTTTAFKTTRTRSFTETSIKSVVTTKTVSFTATKSVTVTDSIIIKETPECPLIPVQASAHPASGTVPVGGGSPEQNTIAKLRAEGIVIVFKTGAQELGQLAIQLGTTLRYMTEQDILFFSDQQGSLGQFLINDALRNVNQTLKTKDPDFEIYREIRKYQQTGQDILRLSEDKTRRDSNGKPPGWVLDKYKFLHMVEESFEMRPNAKWYVFIETDSYVFWNNLAHLLRTLDSRKPIYLGSRVVAPHDGHPISFAHGGSGYVLSHAAMNKLLGPEQPQGLAASWDAKMKNVLYGDLALGKALLDQGVHITGAHPVFNGYKPTTFTYGPDQHWCQPVVTMHHILPHEISAVWRYERRREMLGIVNVTIFADLYTQFVEPHLVPSRANWDNLSHGKTYSQAIQDAAAQAQKATGEKKPNEGAAAAAPPEKAPDPKPQDEATKKATEEEEAAKKKKAEEDENKHKAEADQKKAEEDANKQKAEADKKKAEEDEKKRKAEEDKKKADEAAAAKEKEKEKEREKEKEKEREAAAKKEKEQQKDADTDTDEISRAIAAQKKELQLQLQPRAQADVVTNTAASAVVAEHLVKRGGSGGGAGIGQKREMTAEAQTEGKISAAQGEKRKSKDVKAESTKKYQVPIEGREETKSKPEQEDKTKGYSAAEKVAHESFENCGKVCEEDVKCFQWVFYEKTCRLGMSVRLGQYVPPDKDGKVVWQSGWKVERIRTWTEKNPCDQPEWPEL